MDKKIGVRGSEHEQAVAPPAGPSSPAGAGNLLEWPQPPFHEVVPDVTPPFERAFVTFRDGRKQQGKLMRFSLSGGLVEFCPERAASARVLALSEILELRLVRPVRLRAHSSALKLAPDGADIASASQPFRIRLANDAVVEGETVGFQVHAIGLFLFIRSRDLVVRTFFPTAAIRDKQIGKRLGELLVEGRKLSTDQLANALDRQTEARGRKLGEYLTGAQVIEQDALIEALKAQRKKPLQRIGDVLLEQGAITREQMEAALERQKSERNKPLGEVLVELGFLGRADLTRALTQKLGIPYVALDRFPVDRQVLDLIPRTVAIENNVLPLCTVQQLGERSLVLAIENPLDASVLDRVRFHAGMILTPVMASGDDIRNAIARYFVDPVLDVPLDEIAAELQLNADAVENVDDGALDFENDSALVRLVNRMIADARATGASDIHVETNAGSNPVRIRFRRDGGLREYLTLPPSYRRSLISRIKIMASLDISERRRAQDGKIRFNVSGSGPLDLRIATIPTSDGREDAVLRLLAVGPPLSLDDLALGDGLRQNLESIVARPYGIFVVCGPTGSGKTTTVHSVLAHINKPDRKIWTVEDPIEIQQEGLRQVQVNAGIGWTFAAALRSFLRADPDVILVGEIRDTETADVAIKASLTGHLVLTTLHTNSAVDSVVRLLEMGVQPFNFADSLLGVMSQRLVRRLCVNCRVAEAVDGERATMLAEEHCADTPMRPEQILADWAARHGELRLSHAPGCEACRGSGYRGRLGVYELLRMTPAGAALISHRAQARELRAHALECGMRTLKQDGIEKCLQGVTDLREVRGACG